jgi:hypothetical protein
LASDLSRGTRLAEINGVKSWFAEEHVEKRRVKRLDHEKEELLSRNIPRSQPDDNSRRIRPYPVSDEIRIPRAFLMSAEIRGNARSIHTL